MYLAFISTVKVWALQIKARRHERDRFERAVARPIRIFRRPLKVQIQAKGFRDHIMRGVMV
jgi:hypothetical protein